MAKVVQLIEGVWSLAIDGDDGDNKLTYMDISWELI